jgi:hypothetical protein
LRARFGASANGSFRPIADFRSFGDKAQMKAELRQLLTVEGDFLEELQQRDEVFCHWLRALVGPSGSPGEESFDFAVCSPAWLKNELQRNPKVDGRCMLIFDTFDPKEIEAQVRGRIAQTSGDSWPAVAAKIAEWSHWEFDGYRQL